MSSFAKESAFRNDIKISIKKKLTIHPDKTIPSQSRDRGMMELGSNAMKRSLSPVLEKLPATIRLGQGEGELVLHLMMVNLVNSIDIIKIKMRNKVLWLTATPARVKRIEIVEVFISGANRDLK